MDGKKGKMSIPWCEKYRPNTFDAIVFGSVNGRLLSNVRSGKYFPNLLFFGPPGTGKTTAIINMVSEYHVNTLGAETQAYHKELIIHLNASDDRGIDVIRQQIAMFVQSGSMFITDGVKVVILDEVDNMTENAQQALRYVIQTFGTPSDRPAVRFCLICNYISRIDAGLQSEFVCLRFNQLPPERIHAFLERIVEAERLTQVTPEHVRWIQSMFGSDLRSMINYLQSNQHMAVDVPGPDVWDATIAAIAGPSSHEEEEKKEEGEALGCLEDVLRRYRMAPKRAVVALFKTIYARRPLISPEFIRDMEYITHSPHCPPAVYVAFAIDTCIKHMR